LEQFASKYGLAISQNETSINAQSSSAFHVLVHGEGKSFLVQSAFLEQCIQREGRRSVIYSDKVFDVNAFSTSALGGGASLSQSSDELKRGLEAAGFTVVASQDTCKFIQS
jgi:hypothetical protein